MRPAVEAGSTHPERPSARSALELPVNRWPFAVVGALVSGGAAIVLSAALWSPGPGGGAFTADDPEPGRVSSSSLVDAAPSSGSPPLPYGREVPTHDSFSQDAAAAAQPANVLYDGAPLPTPPESTPRRRPRQSERPTTAESPGATSTALGTLNARCARPAELWVDGVMVGETAISVEIPVGRHRVSLRRGDERDERTVTVQAGTPTNVTQCFGE